MRPSTRGRYATRAMLDLALHYSEEPIKLKEIAKRQRISVQYLEQLFILLKTAG